MRHSEFTPHLSIKMMPPGYSFKSTEYDKFHLLYVQEGCLNLRVYNQDYRLTPGWLALLTKGSQFSLCSQTGYRGLGVMVWQNIPPELSGETRAIKADLQMKMTAELIEHYQLAPDLAGLRVLAGLSHAFTAQAMGLDQRQQAAYKEKWPQMAKAVLDINLGNNISAQQALSHLPLCYRQLSRLFTAAYGMSPKQYQVLSRIKEAQLMLKNSCFSITAIAMELGFSSSQHFATQFKKVTGTTPRDFAGENGFTLQGS
ncbi:MAG: helix-turn-helix transcriptional regulator [Planctomycetes bacterium]|nr:helix-turn-helix transcriptional regulator [Planctomycetota bacterium]